MKVQLWVVVALLSGACTPAAPHSEEGGSTGQTTGTAGSQPAVETAQPSRAGATQAPAAAGPAASESAKASRGDVRGDAAALEQAGQDGKGDARTYPYAATQKDFEDRIDNYMDLRGKAKGDAPALKETDDPAKIKAAQQALAAAIRRERAGAKPGDIFTPAIRGRFRQLMYPELKGEDGRDAKAIIKDDAPSSVTLKVNADYVSDMKPTVPSNVLANLPMLPKELEYRIVNKDLLLLDADANLIVDFIPNAVQ